MQAVLNSPSGQIILESQVFTIGSSPDNSLVIDNLKVSAHHAEIRQEGQGFSITDLGSIHGTYVNGERLDFNSPHLLNQGNSIVIGDMVYTYDIAVTPQAGQTSATLSDQEADTGKPFDEQAEMPFYPQAHEMSVMTVPAGNQEIIETGTIERLPQPSALSSPQRIDYVPMIPPGYNGPIPGYISTEQLRRRDRRFIFIGLGLLVAIALAVGGYFYFTRSTPEKTLDVFCNAIQGQDYQTAFNLLSPSLQGSETELEFAQTAQAGGKVSSCTHGPANTTSNLATASVTLLTSTGQSSRNIVTLIMDSSTWKINMLPSSPDMTLAAFCNALKGKDYPTAYTQLSTDLRRLNAEAQFETDFNGLTCSYHTVTPTGNSASTTVTFTNPSGGTAVATFSLIQDSNNYWKIDSIQF